MAAGERASLIEHGDHAEKRAHARVDVVGMGTVGVTLAETLIGGGASVVGVDVLEDRRSRAALKLPKPAGGGRARLSEVVTTDADAYVFCVQTPLGHDGRANLGPLIAAIEHALPSIRAGATIVIESTVGPGDNSEVLLPIIESELGLVGLDFHYVYAPERVNPGMPDPAYRSIPRVLAGATAECTAAGLRLYERYFDQVIPASSLVAAELTKLLENAYRLVNIALVNEFSLCEEALGFNTAEVVSLAATKPFGYQPFYPSAGAGGHCVPVDPVYLQGGLSRLAGRELTLVARALDLNQRMPIEVADRVDKDVARVVSARDGVRILVVGVSYKAGVDDVRESAAVALIDALLTRGYMVSFWDPRVSSLRASAMELSRFDGSMQDVEVVVFLHSAVSMLEEFELTPEDLSEAHVVSLDPQFPRELLASHEAQFRMRRRTA